MEACEQSTCNTLNADATAETQSTMSGAGMVTARDASSETYSPQSRLMQFPFEKAFRNAHLFFD